MSLAKRNEPRSGAPPQTRDAPEDVALLDRVARGDLSAFESLFHRYCPRLRRFLGRRARRPQLIDEILNDTMFAIWRKAGTFDARSKASTWILGIALRKALKAIERSDRAVVLDSRELQISAEPGPEEHFSRTELRARFDRALKRLSPEHRTVVEMTYFEGYSCREIATIVGCPVDTVKTRMFYARRRLKALLADCGEDAA
jgi:RNA polymerase sigma-70 factor (ECF subfamily)